MSKNVERSVLLRMAGGIQAPRPVIGEEFQRYRDAEHSRGLNPALQDFDAWLASNGSKIAIS